MGSESGRQNLHKTSIDMAEREDNVYKAKLAEQAERYDEMVASMKAVASLDVELTVEERNLLSVSYKNVIGARRASWRIVSSIEQKEESKGNTSNVEKIQEYRKTVEKELNNLCGDIVALLDEHLISSASSSESKVFFHKMKGDYYRYLAEFSTEKPSPRPPMPPPPPTKKPPTSPPPNSIPPTPSVSVS